MRIEDYTMPDGTESKVLWAEEGMKIVRVADGFDFGSGVYLGYRYKDAEGQMLSEKVLEVPEDFTEEELTEEEKDSLNPKPLSD